ncbi:RNA-binding domain-containing protein [Lepidopterella palustris CBS 459.81]|uniref:RNA-binding domain-containing protein n=1 Tax=Lepidopterella palustris CBS 459.81 TaxID=1314670 RepID=A0A8E2E6F3_9PEZI|nr:RNA-binding domain-containing protein [Lepidopterella palustris CBS 459.81]
MGPARKKMKLSEDRAKAVTAEAETEQFANGLEAVPNDEEQKKKQFQERRSLFVRSLAATVTTDDLTELFSQSYPLKHAIAVLDPATKQCKGYGFVTFADAEDAQRAIEEFDGSTLQGRKIRVEIAESRQRDMNSEVSGHKKSIPSGAVAEAKAAREQRKRETQRPPKLIIRNLPWSIKEPEQLALLFRSYGKVKHATVPKKQPGLMAGFGFVVMRGRMNAEKAMEGVNGKEVDGRTLAVDWAVEKDTWQGLQTGAQAEESDDGEDKDAVLEEEGSDESEENDEEDMTDDDHDGGVDIEPAARTTNPNVNNNTLFIRNLPFTVSDESLEDHFSSHFGPVRYARIVLDQATERPKGTGFVCFRKESDADACLKGAPRPRKVDDAKASKKEAAVAVAHSILQNDDSDPTGRYTLEGRILQISRAVDRSEAARITAANAASRFNRDKDKRRLYLLSEGTISTDSPLYQKLSPSEVMMREASAKQRKMLIQTNPSLHISLTRLSVRNIPRSVTSKDLKALAREAVVGFATDVKAGTRQKLSKEELARGGDEMKEAESERRRKGVGVVKQAKIVFETHGGSKVEESTGAGRSRGYGFIEYYTHRSALMGLRWLNGHAIDYRAQENKGKESKEDLLDKKKRLIVEFAIENAQVVNRRTESQSKARERPAAAYQGGNPRAGNKSTDNAPGFNQTRNGQGTRKRKREREGDGKVKGNGKVQQRDQVPSAVGPKDEKLAKRQQIIAKKRIQRRERKNGEKA